MDSPGKPAKDDKKLDAQSAEGLPDDIAPIAKPDAFKKLQPSRMEPGAGRTEVMRPKDDAKKKKGCGLGCLFMLTLLIFVSLTISAIVWMILPFNKAGYQKRWAIAMDIKEAPAENTLHLAPTIEYAVAPTEVETAFIGGIVELRGTFRGDVYVRAIKLHCAPGTVFEKNLEVIAFDYDNEGRVIGELKGQIYRQAGLPNE